MAERNEKPIPSLETVKLPSNQWAWTTDWQIDTDLEMADRDGWIYAMDFNQRFNKKGSKLNYARKRLWTKVSV